MDDHAPAPLTDESSATRPARIRLYPGGPLLVRGDVELIGPDGSQLHPRRRVVALCRCGRSALFPYCDGNHKSVTSFTAERELRAVRNEPDVIDASQEAS
ncbi:MAG TPA: CDGSH iron-sulfur domain-containing protein [Microlunatus sp.]|nr:CDGSH iron-sulfur domain-containing protein [Microlunatus sp.]